VGGEVYDNGRVHVRRERCDRCLFSADRLVSGRRARELVSSTRSTEAGSFVCHRSSIYPQEHTAICRVWFDRYAMEDWVFRLAVALKIIEEV
jgi:hypothetical protein